MRWTAGRGETPQVPPMCNGAWPMTQQSSAANLIKLKSMRIAWAHADTVFVSGPMSFCI
jgi:hypothetical protein